MKGWCPLEESKRNHISWLLCLAHGESAGEVIRLNPHNFDAVYHLLHAIDKMIEAEEEFERIQKGLVNIVGKEAPSTSDLTTYARLLRDEKKKLRKEREDKQTTPADSSVEPTTKILETEHNLQVRTQHFLKSAGIDTFAKLCEWTTLGLMTDRNASESIIDDLNRMLKNFNFPPLRGS
jgi:hypothetical protein